MKKLFTQMLAFILIATILPTPTKASEVPSYSNEELLQIAYELFPEYVSTMQSAPVKTCDATTLSTPRQVIIQEVRDYSDNLRMTYEQYDDGNVYIIAASYIPDYDITDSQSDSSMSTTYTCRLYLTSPYNEAYRIIVSDVKFAILRNTYDHIISQGILSSPTLTNYSYLTQKYNEDASGPACTGYSGDFPRPGTTPDSTNLYFYVGNDTWYVTSSQ